MTAVTLKEFVELMKNDEAALQKLKKLAQEQQLVPEAVTALAAEYGYEITKETVPDIEQLSDDDLENVAGGANRESDLDEDWCQSILSWVGLGDYADYC